MSEPTGAEALELYLDSEDESVATGWRIEDLTSADWALKRVGDLEREIAENEKVLTATVERAKARTEKLNARAANGVRFFTWALQAYAEAHRGELIAGKKKSRALLHGVLSWRKTGGGLVVTDETRLLEWARAHSRIRVKESPALDEIKKDFKDAGVVPDGMDVEPEGEKFVAKPVALEDVRPEL